MDFIVFTVTGVVPPIPVGQTPPYVFVVGNCPTPLSLLGIVLSTTGTTFSPPVSPASPSAVIFASASDFDCLVDCLNQMAGGGIVTLKIYYTIVQGMAVVNAISCTVGRSDGSVVGRALERLLEDTTEIREDTRSIRATLTHELPEINRELKLLRKTIEDLTERLPPREGGHGHDHDK